MTAGSGGGGDRRPWGGGKDKGVEGIYFCSSGLVSWGGSRLLTQCSAVLRFHDTVIPLAFVVLSIGFILFLDAAPSMAYPPQHEGSNGWQ